jgi:hypothetical protein
LWATVPLPEAVGPSIVMTGMFVIGMSRILTRLETRINPGQSLFSRKFPENPGLSRVLPLFSGSGAVFVFQYFASWAMPANAVK